MCVALPGTRSKGVSTPQARTTPSLMSLSRTGSPTVFTRSRNSSSLPGLIVYSYQKVSGCICGCDCCAKLAIQDSSIAKKQKNRRVFIFELLPVKAFCLLVEACGYGLVECSDVAGRRSTSLREK